MDAQRIAVDAIVALTDCDREAAIAFIRKFYLAGVRDPKRLTFKGLQAMSRANKTRFHMHDGPAQQARDAEWARAGDRAPDNLRWLYDHDPAALT